MPRSPSQAYISGFLTAHLTRLTYTKYRTVVHSSVHPQAGGDALGDRVDGSFLFELDAIRPASPISLDESPTATFHGGRRGTRADLRGSELYEQSGANSMFFVVLMDILLKQARMYRQ